MRSFLAFVIVLVGAMSLVSLQAFNASSSGARTVAVDVVGDASAYLAIVAGPSHATFVDAPAGGKVSIAFDDPDGAGSVGSGINIASTYYFDDILKIINQGTTTVDITVTGDTASTPAGVALEVCVTGTSGTMTNGCYGATDTLAGFAVTNEAFIGVKVIESGGSAGTGFALDLTISADRP